eukprot:4248905-Amphidinium_carterae.1
MILRLGAVLGCLAAWVASTALHNCEWHARTVCTAAAASRSISPGVLLGLQLNNRLFRVALLQMGMPYNAYNAMECDLCTSFVSHPGIQFVRKEKTLE